MLNPEQQAAAAHSGSVLLVAPPGSGKTKTLVARIGMIRSRNEDARVIAVSYTRDSADELKSRALLELGAWAESNVKFGTFHSLCKEQVERATGKKLQLIDDIERSHLVLKALRRCNFDLDEEDAFKLIEQEKTMRTSGANSDSEAGRTLTDLYQGFLQELGSCDFHDLLSQAINGMNDATVAALPCNDLLIDELQDIDNPQKAWAIATIAANRATLFGVGDDDQSIFAFRQALGHAGMLSLAANSNAKQILLTLNYRSHSEIVNHASRLIEKNANRFHKRIEAVRGPGGGITYSRYKESDEEAADIATFAASTEGTWGILARNKRALYGIQAFLSANSIEHRSIGKTIWEEQPVRMLLIALGVTAQLAPRPASKNAFYSYVGATDTEINSLKNMNDAMWLGGSKNNLPRTVTCKPLHLFAERLSVWNAFCTEVENTDLAILGVTEWLISAMPSVGKKSERDKGLVRTAQKALSRMTGSIKRRLGTVMRLDAHKSDARIVLSTFHGAKGLEWDYVWLVAASEGVIPDERSPIEEERRLFYVALTRPRKRLIISTPGGVASSFIHEAFPDHKNEITSGYMHIGQAHGVSPTRQDPMSSSKVA